MNIILYCNAEQRHLLPLTFMKPAGELRMGILSFRERWERLLTAKVSYITEDYLSELFPLHHQDDNIFIHSCYLPSHALVNFILELDINQGIQKNNELIAFRGNLEQFQNHQKNLENASEFQQELVKISRPYDLFSYNHLAIDFDFELITKGRESQPISATNGLIHSERIFLEEGAKVEFSVLNATEGPIYLGKNSEVCEGSLVRGGLALCENAKLNLGTKIYGATTIGPWCKVGGEVNNSILMAYSNKGHDGFLGNSVIGEWCNLGADTNNSNLKNNYSEVRLWNYDSQKFENTGLQFCGLMMGDHCKSAINTQFNTGTVAGVFANIFKSGFPPNNIESFSWGGMKDDPEFKLEAAYDIAQKMMERRKVNFSPELKKVIKYLYNLR
ncbi:MAG: GlmU family protein [Flavobacteriaceae bacterium]|nr:GlmU family protein [Flavobacteriaceae bacterium]